MYHLIYTISLTTAFSLFLSMHSRVIGQSSQVDSIYTFNAQGGLIPDFENKAVPVIFEIEVLGIPADAEIGLRKACLSILHKRTSDIKVELLSPSGESVWLTNRNGGLDGRNYNNTCFSAEGFSGYIHQAKAPFEGDYIPDGRMEFINQVEPNGTWKVLVYDLAKGIEGYLTRLSLVFSTLSQKIEAPCEQRSATFCKCPSDGQTTCDLLPDLVLLDEFTSSTVKAFSSDHPVYPNQLRFSVSIANIGDGPFEVVVDDNHTTEHKHTHLTQMIYKLKEGDISSTERDGGTIYYDDSPGHDHYHVNDWVEFKLYRVKRFLIWTYREEVATARKVSFCLFDSGICDGITDLCELKGTIYGPNNLTNYGMGSYMSCGQEKQGISVGGYDTYGYSYEGQYISLPSDLTAGLYVLEITIDPLGRYREKDVSNNRAVFHINLP